MTGETDRAAGLTNALVEDGLGALLQPGAVTDVAPLASGFEADVFSFRLWEDADRPAERVIRLGHEAAAAAATAHGFVTMRRLAGHGFPVPAAQRHGRDFAGTGRPSW